MCQICSGAKAALVGNEIYVQFLKIRSGLWVQQLV